MEKKVPQHTSYYQLVCEKFLVHTRRIISSFISYSLSYGELQ